MTIEIVMPKMGESIMDGTIIKWHKKPGDPVHKDEVLFEIATDKVDAEVPSPENGVLEKILVPEQSTVEVGTVVARILAEGGTNSSNNTSSSQSESNSVNSDPVLVTDELTSQAGINEDNRSSNRFYSPLVMNIARKENITAAELNTIKGTGADGRVTKKDILLYLEKKTTSAVEPADVQRMPSAEAAAFFTQGRVETVPMDFVRVKIMEHMIKSRDTSVHVTEVIEVDMTNAAELLRSRKQRILADDGVKITYLSFVAFAVTKALRQHNLLNSAISGTQIIKKKFVNLGIAVALEPDGLIVPNIKNAQDKSFLGLASSINEITERARKRKLTPDDITGGTFTLTNYGVFGTLLGTPVINQPEVAILGIGAVVKKPVVIEIGSQDTIAIRPMMYLSLSHDHRLIDGMAGGKFLKSVKEILESFRDI